MKSLEVGVEELVAKAAQNQVRSLGQENHMLESRTDDRSGSRTGQAGNRAEQRAFSAATGTHDDEPFGRLHDQGKIINNPALVIKRLQRQAIDCKLFAAEHGDSAVRLFPRRFHVEKFDERIKS